jgi:outer membrane protein G
MKKIFASAMIFTVGLVMAQTDAYKGVGDIKVNLGANLQDGGTGIVSSVDYGLGESFSIGAQAGYLLGVDELDGGGKPVFGDRFDLKVRLNANLGSVLKLPSNVDVYPGLNLGLKNFGGHLGARYFFDKGFGLYTEMQFPIAKYKKSEIAFDDLNNQFAVNIGVSFDIDN